MVIERIIFVRVLKHFLRMAMRESSIMHLGMTIVNILNSTFAKKNYLLFMEDGIIPEGTVDNNTEKEPKKKKKKKNKEVQENFQESEKDLSQIINVIQIPMNKYATMKPREIWEELTLIAKARFSYEFPPNL